MRSIVYSALNISVLIPVDFGALIYIEFTFDLRNDSSVSRGQGVVGWGGVG